MIDLRSDTVTKPTPEMKQAMFEAEVGDDVMGEDPTVNKLEAKVSALLGQEAAMFTCSSTQANQIAIKIHTSPGDELLINSTGHIGLYESGAPAAISGVTIRKIEAPDGMLRLEDLENTLLPDDQHFCRSRLVCLENPTNIGGGFPYALSDMVGISEWAHANDLKIHLDGARLFNAIVSAGYSAHDVGKLFDTVTLCFSKSLGCPMGAMLAGTVEDIHRARRVRKMLGGGMRQIGFAAAAAIFALDHYEENLIADHENAQVLGKGLSAIDGLSLVVDPPETSMVFFDLSSEIGSAKDLQTTLETRGVKIGVLGKQRMRAVTHLDVSSDDISTAIVVIRESMDSLRG